MKKSLRVVLLFLLSLAVIGALLWFGDIKKVGALIEHFQRIYFLWFLLLMLAHEALRTALWVYLLRALCLDVPLRTAVFAFAAGEAAKFVPTGAYFQNYLLQRSRDVDFGRSSAATTYIIVSEIAAALALVAIIGLGPWTIWRCTLIRALRSVLRSTGSCVRRWWSSAAFARAPPRSCIRVSSPSRFCCPRPT
jgi:hypothetical protein